MNRSNRLALAHYWVAFGTFLPAVLLGAWQMLMRSPLPAPLDDSAAYYASVTLHGTAMAYVVTTFFTMGFGYAVAATSLGRPLRGAKAAWVGFAICLVGTLMAVVAILSGRASVLYTFYPPLSGQCVVLRRGVPAGRRLDDLGRADGSQHDAPGNGTIPGRPVPLPMFAITATAILWAWTRFRRRLRDLVGILLPRAFGWSDLIDAALGAHAVLRDPARNRLLLADARVRRLLHPGAAGGRWSTLQRHDGAARPSYMFLVFSTAGRHAPSLHGPRARSGFQVPAVRR